MDTGPDGLTKARKEATILSSSTSPGTSRQPTRSTDQSHYQLYHINNIYIWVKDPFTPSSASMISEFTLKIICQKNLLPISTLEVVNKSPKGRMKPAFIVWWSSLEFSKVSANLAWALKYSEKSWIYPLASLPLPCRPYRILKAKLLLQE